MSKRIAPMKSIVALTDGCTSEIKNHNFIWSLHKTCLESILAFVNLALMILDATISKRLRTKKK